MAQPAETATDYRHTHKDLGLVTVKVYEFVSCVFYAELGQMDGWTDGRYQMYYLPCFALNRG